MIRVSRLLAPNHSCAEGHFPGNPIIPGAVLVDEVLSAIEQSSGWGACVWIVQSAKFVSPVRPGDELVVSFESSASGAIRFEGTVQGHTVITGLVRSHTSEAMTGDAQ